MRANKLGAALAIASLGLTGCGGDALEGKRPELRVGAATSLKSALTEYAGAFGQAGVRLSFAGSDELTAQAASGAPIDVLLVADPGLLDRAGAIEARTVFATNALVIAVPAGSDEVRSYRDLSRPGIRVASGSQRSPIGRYTRRFLDALPAPERAAIARNIRTEEPDAAGVVGKVTVKAVDAGIVYASDVTTSQGRLEAIPIPGDLGPGVAYGAAVLRRTSHPDEARAFVAGLRGQAGTAALQRAGLQRP